MHLTFQKAITFAVSTSGQWIHAERKHIGITHSQELSLALRTAFGHITRAKPGWVLENLLSGQLNLRAWTAEI